MNEEYTKKTEYAGFIREELNERELLEQLAEECAELGKAALKVIRADEHIKSRNYTPLSNQEARENLKEEVCDVLMVLMLLDTLPGVKQLDNYWKWERWAARLGYGAIAVCGDE